MRDRDEGKEMMPESKRQSGKIRGSHSILWEFLVGQSVGLPAYYPHTVTHPMVIEVKGKSSLALKATSLWNLWENTVITTVLSSQSVQALRKGVLWFLFS